MMPPESAAEPGKVVAFYSFKGGTGRSMALANVGCVLAQDPNVRGAVLLVDWDLEAPGLHRYFRKHLFNAFRGTEEQQEAAPGLIELFIEMRNRVEEDHNAAQGFESAAKLIATLPLEEYVIKTDIPGLHIIKAGRFDDEYAQKVGTFEWLNLYRKSPFLLRTFASRLASEYQYVLIDSRTGLTDTSGICAMLLPEVLVAVFTPNRQSVSGVINLVRDAGRYRSRSDDLRPLVVYPLPSRIEASEPTLRKLWRTGDKKSDLLGFQREFEEVFKLIYGLKECDLSAYFDEVQIQHVPKYAYGEEIAVLGEEARDRLSLTRSFQKFGKKLADGQLPWLASTTQDDDEFPRAEDISDAYEQIREIASASYIREVIPSIERLKRKSSRQQSMLLYAGMAAVVTTTTVATISDRLLVTIPLIVAAALMSAVIFLLGRTGDPIKQAVTEIDRELDAFKSKQAPYDRDDALEKLRGRLEPILARAPATGSARRANSVFICYRREDAYYAARLQTTLSSAIGLDRVFLDVDTIPPGVDFTEVIDTAIDAAEMVLVIIGPGWINSDRLHNATDFVRLEIASALARNKLVIPVLVGGSNFPRQTELPADIQKLALRQAVLLSDARWDADALRLIRTVNEMPGT